LRQYGLQWQHQRASYRLASVQRREECDGEQGSNSDDYEREESIIAQDDVEPPYGRGQVRGCLRVLGCRFLGDPSWHPPEAFPAKAVPITERPLWGATFATGTVLLDRVLQEQFRFSGRHRRGLLSDPPAE
jgi:hypothetical protein